MSTPTLRDLLPADIDFLYWLCESTMKVHVVSVWGNWPSEKVREGLAEALAKGQFKSVEVGEKRVGAISVVSHESHLQLVQMYILPEFQNQGVGSALVSQVVTQARSLSKPVRLRVLAPNRARALYERLGFKVIESNPERFVMECAG